MIGPTTDQRIIIPHAPRWELTGGAHTDGQEIVLPTIGATATVWLPLRGRVARLTWQLTRVWTSPDWANRQVTRQATYWDASRTRQVEPTTPASGRVNTPDPPRLGDQHRMGTIPRGRRPLAPAPGPRLSHLRGPGNPLHPIPHRPHRNHLHVGASR